MIKEGPPTFESEPMFKVGDLVILRPNLRPEIVDALSPQITPGLTYKIFHIAEYIEDEDCVTVAYLGPADLLLREDEMEPKTLLDRKDMFPVGTTHLTKATRH